MLKVTSVRELKVLLKSFGKDCVSYYESNKGMIKIVLVSGIIIVLCVNSLSLLPVLAYMVSMYIVLDKGSSFIVSGATSIFNKVVKK